MPKNTYYHIVVSPPVEFRPQLEDYMNTLERLFIKHTIEYCIAIEHGSNIELTHLDIYVQFKKGQDSTDIKRKYSKIFPFVMDLPAVCIKSIKTKNPAIMTGYTLKENPQLFKTNIPDHKLKENDRIYNEKSKEKATKSVHKTIKLKQIIEFIGSSLENRKINIWANQNIKNSYEPYALNEIPRVYPNSWDICKQFEESVAELLFQGYYLDITNNQKHSIYKYFCDYYSEPIFGESQYLTEFIHSPQSN
ncbi:MAG: putative replicase [Circoviridae sp.]|nr:MAG: putative replicase [Circoviridae sp.]